MELCFIMIFLTELCEFAEKVVDLGVENVICSIVISFI